VIGGSLPASTLRARQRGPLRGEIDGDLGRGIVRLE
jgi:hypothetical protein